ncbi:pentapeptide repeat-containing protein [Phormidesmis priestleyi]|nr:pentapeptide repeat-containing protein [Phormidesmis priestleyi]
MGQTVPAYLLTADTCSTFAPTQFIPPLTTITQSKNGKGMDFSYVDLSGQDVSGVDFTGANFTEANLTGTIFEGAILTQAVFVGANLDQTSFDGATLDQANFSGSNTVLTTVQWGQPKSAQTINFSGCDGRGTKLVGTSGNLIPCNSANFTNNANFSGATLSYLMLDAADLTGAIAARANFTGSSLQQVKAHGSNFCGAILNQANLSNSQFGAKALLFVLTTNLSNYITELNQSDGKAVPQDIINAFNRNGIDVLNSIVTVLVSGQSWLITTGTIAYNLLLSADSSQLLVYRYGGAVAASFAGASLNSSTSSGANFSSVDLSNSLWHNAIANHTDLESTNLAGSFFLEADFTQAIVAGTIFSSAVLIQTRFRGVQLTNPGFTNAQLQGADFTDATLINGNLYQAAISLPFGVPLFVMDSSYTSDLNNGDLAAITPFTSQGYPLGKQASLSPLSGWLIDNSMDTTPSIKTFFIDVNLNVYDFLNPTKPLFFLSTKYKPFLNNPNPNDLLINWFKSNNCSLSAQAVIAPITAWNISNSPDAPVPQPVIYERIAIVSEADGCLHVYGTTLLWLKNFPTYPSDIAFGSTLAIQTAINSQTICPNGQPNSEFDPGFYTWEQMMTCPHPVTPSYLDAANHDP